MERDPSSSKKLEEAFRIQKEKKSSQGKKNEKGGQRLSGGKFWKKGRPLEIFLGKKKLLEATFFAGTGSSGVPPHLSQERISLKSIGISSQTARQVYKIGGLEFEAGFNIGNGEHVQFLVDPGVGADESFACTQLHKSVSKSLAMHYVGDKSGVSVIIIDEAHERNLNTDLLLTELGMCYRLYSKADYQSMELNQEPEIRRVHLGVAVSKILALGVKECAGF
ncbi:hypothetical protein VNO77_01945 [Canavalia gladiata]|uniref:RNA helicase n=1 Tax=Canavalia gladiata TaxID=3824 RepID=A0AAN9R2K7_CANGL